MLRLLIAALLLLSFACGAARQQEKASPSSTHQTRAPVSVTEAQRHHRELVAARLTEPEESSGKKVPIQLIRNLTGKLEIHNCGCYFKFPEESRRSNRHVFFEDFSEESPLMNIAGRNVKLELVDSSEPTDYSPKVGDQFRREYQADGVKILMDFVTISVCDQRDETCESTGYNVTISVIAGDHIQTINAVGGCGC